MKWFVITNREKSKTTFGYDPERYGKSHFLSKETKTFPKRNKDLNVKYLGSHDNRKAVRKFVSEIQAELKKRVKKLKSKGIDRKPCLVVYTHGYNNDYKEALEEYSEIRRNFNSATAKGVEKYEDHCLTILFTWPSAGWVTAYLEDRDDARASSPAVSNMVNILYDVTNNLKNCISNVCVIAHSMGNYVFREALTSLVGSSRSPAGTFIDQFIMIGADVGNSSLEYNGKGLGITRFSNRVSVYFSPADSTLAKSKRKNGRPRLGRTLSSGYTQTPDNVVFCDCREWANEKQLKQLFEKPPSVHSCYRSIDAILKDMFYTLIGIDREMIPERKMLVMNKLYRLVAKSED